MRCRSRAVLAAAMLVMLPVVEAHTGGSSYVDVRVEPNTAAPQLQVDVALPDVAAALRLDRDADGRLRWREVLAAQLEIASYLQARLQMSSAGRPCHPGPIAQPLLVDRDTGRHLRMLLAFSCAEQGGQLSLDASPWFVELADQGVYVTSDGGSDQVLLLTKDRPAAALDAAHQQGFRRFWILGALHLLSGYDHLAFLALLLLGAVRRSNPAIGMRSLLWETARIATAFTAAHSITLALAATGALQIPAAPVEIAIAASIFITAVVVFAGADRWIGWPLAFGFGLVHGLGFANVLAELLTGRSLLAPLLGFNLGIEVAQLLVIAVVAPLLWQALSRPRLLRSTSAASALLLAGLSVYWMAQRWP